MVSIRIDDSELRQLAVDLSGAPLRVQFGAKKALMRGAQEIDAEMVVDASGHTGNWFGNRNTTYGLTGLPAEVSHELIGPWTAEIGINYRGQGKLAHIIVYGSVNNAPVYDHMAGPTRAMPRVTERFADTAEDSVLGSERG